MAKKTPRYVVGFDGPGNQIVYVGYNKDGSVYCTPMNLRQAEKFLETLRGGTKTIFKVVPIHETGDSAPELLDALETALHALTLSDDCQDEIADATAKIRAAIAKAEGVSQ